jgi:Tol biopolymer transport system component
VCTHLITTGTSDLLSDGPTGAGKPTMATNAVFRILRNGLILLFLFRPMICIGKSPDHIGSVAISPDGKLIAVGFEKGATSFIYKIAVDTGNATRLTNVKTGKELSPAFSTDGKRIAYSYSPGDGAHFSIVIGNVDGSDLRTWSPSETNDFSPVLSPDNETIIFSRSGFYGSYSPIAQPHRHGWRFYASELDGTNVREINEESFYMASPASVSPDGKSMVVVTEGIDTNRQIAIYSLDRHGQPTQSLRPHVPKEADRKDPILNCPNYLPDGKSILFMAASFGKHGFDYDVYRIDLETGSLERLTNGNGYATDLKVSADGKTAVFLKWRSDWRGTPDRSELYLLDVQSHKLTSFRVNGLN